MSSLSGNASRDHQCLGAIWNLRLGSYHWHNAKAVDGLKLNLMEHHSFQPEFVVYRCRSIRVIPEHSPLSKHFKIFLWRSDKNRTAEWVLLKPV